MALFSYGRPSNIAWSIAGTGAGIDGDPALLTNGRPADPCRLHWLSSGSPVIGDDIVLTGDLGAEMSVRCAAVLFPQNSTATKLPAGTKIVLTGLLASSPVTIQGNASAAVGLRTSLLPNGAVAIWFVFPAVTIDNLLVHIFNDKNGATWATASMPFDIGEIWVGNGADFNVKWDTEEQLEGGLLQRLSHNNQSWPLQTQPFKGYSINLVPMSEAIAIGPNAQQDDWETVYYAMSTASASVLIPRYMKRGSGPAANGQPPAVIDTSTIDAQRLVRSAKLGVLDANMKTVQTGDLYFTATAQFGETPP